jgi:hypothetical protein
VEKLGAVLDLHLRFAIKLLKHFAGLVFIPEHRVLKGILDVNVATFPERFEWNCQVESPFARSALECGSLPAGRRRRYKKPLPRGAGTDKKGGARQVSGVRGRVTGKRKPKNENGPEINSEPFSI